ncbi:MAG: NAD-binding protein [Spirochaetales bacterium]|nr:NAD-binding protein [Spirochaetales bacterium]
MKKKVTGFIRKIKKRIFFALKNPFTYLFILISILLVVATFIVHGSEPYHPDGEVTNWRDAIWHSVVAVVAAYYDYYMKTVPGRLASLGLLLLGMAFWTIVLGKITESIMSVQDKNNKGLKKLKRMKGHFILCGWRKDYEDILEAVVNSNGDITNDMIVLVNNGPLEEIERVRSDSRFRGMKFVSGDFSDADTLKRAFIGTASRVLIISDHSGGTSEMEIDSRTVLSVLTMKNLNPKVYIAAELLSEKFQEQLRMAHCDEIILTTEYEHSLLATASSGQGYSNVIKALISDDSDSGVVIEGIAARFYGTEYRNLSLHYETKSKGSEILVGIFPPGSEPILTPKDDYVIPEKAKAVIIRAREAEIENA